LEYRELVQNNIQLQYAISEILKNFGNFDPENLDSIYAYSTEGTSRTGGGNMRASKGPKRSVKKRDEMNRSTNSKMKNSHVRENKPASNVYSINMFGPDGPVEY
jgi:hypothetical protein